MQGQKKFLPELSQWKHTNLTLFFHGLAGTGLDDML